MATINTTASDLLNASTDTSSADTASPLDTFTEFLHAPATKLDADQYSADDLDGVTESLFGSGNLNFLIMQSGQTDAAMALNHSLSTEISDAVLGDRAAPSTGSLYTAVPSSDDLGHAIMNTALAAPMSHAGSVPGGGGFLPAVAPGAASFLHGESPAFSLGSESLSHDGITPGFPSGNDGANGSNGHNGGDGGTGGGSTVIDLGDVTNTVTQVVHNAGDLLQTIVDNTSTTINHITDQLPILPDDPGVPGDHDASLGLAGSDINLPFLDPIEDLIGDADTAISLGQGSDGSSISLHGIGELAGGVLGNADLSLPLPLVSTLLGQDTALGINLGGDILGSTAPNVLDALSGGSGADNNISGARDGLTGQWEDTVGGGDNSGGQDSDLGLGADTGALSTFSDTLGLGDIIPGELVLGDHSSLNVILDPVENLTGDIDTGGAIAVLGQGETDNAAGDQDLGLGGDIQILDAGLLHIPTIDIGLDPLESLTGDIDLHLDAATNLLGDLPAAGLLNNGAGGTGGDTMLAQVQDGATDPVQSLTPDLSAALDGGLSAPETAIDTSDLSGSLSGALDAAPADIVPQITDGTETVIGSAMDLMSQAPAGGDVLVPVNDALDNLSGGWTESTIPDAGSVLGTMGGGDISQVLSDPVSALGDALGSALGGSSHSGLLGLGDQGHHGGLFG